MKPPLNIKHMSGLQAAELIQYFFFYLSQGSRRHLAKERGEDRERTQGMSNSPAGGTQCGLSCSSVTGTHTHRSTHRSTHRAVWSRKYSDPLSVCFIYNFFRKKIDKVNKQEHYTPPPSFLSHFKVYKIKCLSEKAMSRHVGPLSVAIQSITGYYLFKPTSYVKDVYCQLQPVLCRVPL